MEKTVGSTDQVQGIEIHYYKNIYSQKNSPSIIMSRLTGTVAHEDPSHS